MNPTTGGESGKPADLTRTQHKTITMADIARASGVSQGAISSLLNDRDYGIRVSERTRDRVFKACRELGYVPNDLRAVVRMYPERGDVCLLVAAGAADLANRSSVARIEAGAMSALDDSHRAVVVAQFDPALDYGANADLLPPPVQNGTASKFLFVSRPNASLVQSIRHRGFPVIVAGHELVAPGVTSILPDYAGAARLAMEYLFKLGHQHVAILCGAFGETDPQVVELRRGVKEAYGERGETIEAQNVIFAELNFRSGFNAFDAMLKRQPPPTAVFCLNDVTAAGVLAAATERGIRVPGDLSVMGCSDDPFCELLAPALTTVHVPAEEMGAAAVAEANLRIADKEHGLEDAKRIALEPSLMERASCSGPKITS